LWSAYGDELYAYLDQANHDALASVVGARLAEAVLEGWSKFGASDTVKWLLVTGIDLARSRKVMRIHGVPARELITQDPERLWCLAAPPAACRARPAGSSVGSHCWRLRERAVAGRRGPHLCSCNGRLRIRRDAPAPAHDSPRRPFQHSTTGLVVCRHRRLRAALARVRPRCRPTPRRCVSACGSVA
jgi:hypothetical protein